MDKSGQTEDVFSYTPQWQEKLGWLLYPSNHIDMPEMPNKHDCFVCRTSLPHRACRLDPHRGWKGNHYYDPIKTKPPRPRDYSLPS